MLSKLFPAPVEMPLGGGIFMASQFRMGDLADMERWALWRLGRVERYGSLLTLQDPEARKAALCRAYLAVEADPGHGFGSKAVDEVLATPEGAVLQLWLSLRQAHPKFGQADAIELLGQVTAEQWHDFTAWAWNVDPLDELAGALDRLIGVTLPEGEAPTGSDWERAVGDVIEKTGWTLDEIKALTLGQWDAIRRGGERKAHPVAEPDPPLDMTFKTFTETVNVPREKLWKWWEEEGKHRPPAAPAGPETEKATPADTAAPVGGEAATEEPACTSGPTQ